MTAGRSQIESWNCVPGLFLHIRRIIMADNEIRYTTVEQQIEKLKQQNLIIDDEKFAKDSLTFFWILQFNKKLPRTLHGYRQWAENISFRCYF